MDYFLLGFLLFFCFVGFYKGFLSSFSSLISTFFLVAISWKLSPIISRNFDFSPILEKTLNSFLPGKFTDISQFNAQISQKNNIFSYFLSKILSNIYFEGEMTAGQILSPTLNNFLAKIVAFLIIFIILIIVFKIIKKILNKVVGICGFSSLNRLLGGVVGIAKGFVLFLLFYAIFCGIANFTLNENMLNFVQSGVFSSKIYQKITEIIIEFL